MSFKHPPCLQRFELPLNAQILTRNGIGQIEVFFTLLIAMFWLKQKVKIKEVFALVMIAIAAILVMWG